MEQEVVKNLIVQITFFSAVCSVMTFGIKATIKAVMKKNDEEKLNRFIGLGLIYALGMMFGFVIKNEYITNVLYKIVFGFSIGTMAVASYQSVVKSLLNLVPKVMEKLLGVK